MVPDSASPGKNDEFKDRDRLILALKQLQEAYARQAEVIERYERLYHDMKKPGADVLEELEVQRELNRVLAKKLSEKQEDLEAQKEELQSRMEELQLLLEQQSEIEAAASRSEGDFRAIVGKNADAMVVLDGDGRVQYVNPAAEEMFHLPASEMVGKLFGHPVVPDKPVQMLVLRQYKSLIHVEMRLVEVTWADKPSCLISLRDMTDRIKAERAMGLTKGKLEKALLKKNVQFKNALDSLDDEFAIYDFDWRYMYANDAAAKAAGMPKGQMIGKNVWELFPQSVGTRQCEQSMKTMEDKTPRTWIDHSEITDIWREYRAVPWEDGIAIIARDITERKRAEEELDRSQALLKAITDNTPDPVYIKDLESRILLCNPALLRIYGKPLAEVIGKTDRELYDDPAIGEAIVANDRRVLGAGQSMAIDEMAQTPDGLRTFISTKTPYRDSYGNIIGVFGISRDITERKKAEEALRESMAKYRQIVEGTNDGIVIVDKDWRITFANEQMARMLGYSPEELLGRSSGDFADPEWKAWGEDRFSVRKRGQSERYEMKYRKKDGSVLWTLSYGNPIYDDTGKFVGSQSFHVDITERKRVEEQLTQQANLLSMVHDGVWAVDAEFRFTYWNKGAERILGWTAEEVLGKVANDLLKTKIEGGSREESIKKMLLDGHYEGEACYRHKDGRYVPVEVDFSVVKGPDGGMKGLIVTGRDITERKQDEEVLRESEARFRSVLDNSVDCIYRLNIQTSRYEYISPACEKLVGYTAEELMAQDLKTAMPMIYADDIPTLQAAQVRCNETGKAVVEYRQWTKGGELRWISNHMSTVLDRDGRPLYRDGNLRDVTAHKRAEEALRERERMNSFLFDKAPAMMQLARFDDGTLVRINEQTVKTYGFAREELIGKKTSELGINRDFKGRDVTLKELRQKGSVHDVEMPLYTRSGEKIIVSNNLDVVELDGEKYLLSVSYDITERKRAEMILKDSDAKIMEAVEAERRRLYDVLEGLPAMVCLLTKDYRVPFANKAFRDLFGESNGRRCYEYCFGLDRPCEFCESYTVLETGRPHTWEVTNLSGNRIEVHDYPFTDVDGTPMILEMDLDITEHLRTENALKEAKQQAELYVDLMGHDINNMHQIALGYLELARDMPAGGEQAAFLDKPVEVLQRSAQLINNVRKLQKLHDGVFQTQDVDVSHVLKDVQREFEALSNKRVMLNINGYESCFVRANELLHDVFANLVGNAVKHTGDYADVIVDMDIVGEADRRYCRVMVEDDGPGIPDDFKAAIFNRTLKGTNKARGMGLGLYLVKSLADSYGGKVWVEDRVIGDHGKGARFVVLLPVIEK